VVSRRGKTRARARIGEIEPGHVFVPFHFGDWDKSNSGSAANELTVTGWDPVSKQPHFKYAAVKLVKVAKERDENTHRMPRAGASERVPAG
jgi:anaerobic selenocysteine-containing dehydrogenase